MVLAPNVLAALAVVVKERLAVLVERHAAHRHGHHLFGATAFGAHLIQFSDPRRCKLHVFSRFLDLGGEIDFLPIRRECQRDLGGRVCGDTLGHTAFGRYQIDIEIAVTIGGEGDLFAVGRPHWVGIVSSVCSDLQGFAASGVHHIHIAFVAEGDLVALGRNHVVAHPKRLCGELKCHGKQGKEKEFFHRIYFVDF